MNPDAIQLTQTGLGGGTALHYERMLTMSAFREFASSLRESCALHAHEIDLCMLLLFEGPESRCRYETRRDYLMRKFDTEAHKLDAMMMRKKICDEGLLEYDHSYEQTQDGIQRERRLRTAILGEVEKVRREVDAVRAKVLILRKGVAKRGGSP